MSKEKKGGMMQSLKRVVTKKRSTTTMGEPLQQSERRSPVLWGPAPLAQSTIRAPKWGGSKQRPRTQMHWGLMGEQVPAPPPRWVDVGQQPARGPKTRMRFPCQYQEGEDDTGDFGASPPGRPSYACTLIEAPPVQLKFTPPRPTGHDPNEENVSRLVHQLDDMEEQEMGMIIEDVKEFQRARRKLVMDKKFFDMKAR